MNAPLCPGCGKPLATSDRFCQQCGRPSAYPAGSPTTPQQPTSGSTPAGPAYGAIPSANPFPPNAQAYAGSAQPGVPGPGRQPLLTIGVVAAVLVVAAVAVVAIMLATGGDDKQDDVAGGDPTSRTTEPSDDPSDNPSATLRLPPPPSASTPPSAPTSPGLTLSPAPPLTRTPSTGSDRNQIRQLVRDTDDWVQRIYAGDTDACDQMGLYFGSTDAKAIGQCKKSTVNPLPAGTSARLEPGKVTVKGSRGTVEMVLILNGKKEDDPSEEKVVKKNGTWYFADFT